ncbi:PQ loop repeat protein [Tricharina praecox]|uniref:PQ loop repeat protein n=1 Tax=Tricharina praecox TaxID=43433 RepID=UPI00221F1799|nr:PQ loop repeat protein [Tricharina praecox]KAI5856263.1 PQ loop repeat protein [Tricharina praecox]
MAQAHHPIAATVLGLIGTICWCIQLIPQIVRNYRSKSTEGLPGSMMFLWGVSGVPFGVYALLQNLNIPLQVQPQIFMVLSLTAWGQCLHYSHSFSSLHAILLSSGLLAVLGGLEAVLVLFLPRSTAALTTVGVVAAVLLAAGLLPPYREIVKRRGRVVGIDWVFLMVDWAGAFFSLMSLVAQEEFDVLAGVMYIACLCLESGIFACGVVWWVRHRGRKGDVDLEGVGEGEVEGKEEKAV